MKSAISIGTTLDYYGTKAIVKNIFVHGNFTPMVTTKAAGEDAVTVDLQNLITDVKSNKVKIVS